MSGKLVWKIVVSAVLPWLVIGCDENPWTPSSSDRDSGFDAGAGGDGDGDGDGDADDAGVVASDADGIEAGDASYGDGDLDEEESVFEFGLSPSENGRYLVTSSGEPIFLSGDTAWTMPENASREDVRDYLNDREARGFNYFQIVAVRDLDGESLDCTDLSRTMNPENMNGHRPFEWTDNDRADISQPISVPGGTPNAPNDYWDHLEYILQEAVNREMYVGILPVWGKYYINNRHEALRLFTEETAHSYGRFLGERYSDYPNIIWILGGDCGAENHVDGRPIYRNLAEGLAVGTTGHDVRWNEQHPAWDDVDITYHGNPTDMDGDAWLRIRMIYYSENDIHPNTLDHWNDTSPRPLMIGESRYEGWIWNDTYKSPDLIRRQAYHAIFAGSLGGYVYGSAMSSLAEHDQMFKFQPGWRNRLDLPGCNAMAHVRELVQQYRWWTWVPAQELIVSGAGADETLKAAVRSTDGDHIFVYFADRSSASIDMTAITTHDRASVLWIDPRNGERVDGGVYSTSQIQSFSPPGAWEDAVLVLTGTDDELDEPDSLADFQTIDGEVVIAAEDFSSTEGDGPPMGEWNEEFTEDGFIGDSYLRSSTDRPDDGSHLRFNEDAARLNYDIQFNETGRYFVHLRTFARDHTENGFFITLDGVEIDYGGANPDDPSLVAYFVYVKKPGRWNWYTDGGGAETRELEVSFVVHSPGVHRFAIHRRDTGSRIDHLWLTTHESIPQNTGTLDLPNSDLFAMSE